MEENGVDEFMAIFGFYRLREVYKPCYTCIIAKGFSECDTDSYEWIKK